MRFLGILLILSMQVSSSVLPDWTQAGYRGTGNLPTEQAITTAPDCLITPQELADTYGVIADDQVDDSAGLQGAIDTIRDQCEGDYEKLSLIQLPSGTLNTSTEIHIDASFLIVRGDDTRIMFEPDSNTIYDGVPEDFDLGAMEDVGTANGGWIWPGRGAFRIQTRAVHPDYAEDYADAAPNRRDFYEGSVNFHWKSGIVVTEDSAQGDLTITLESTDAIQVGDTIWVGAPNTTLMYTTQGVDPDDWTSTEYMRQQMFTIVAINGDTITLDKPLEFDLPHDSTADGSQPIDGNVRDAKVIPLTIIEGVGIENIELTQVLPGYTPQDAAFNYTNLDRSRAMNGFVFKWAINSYLRNVHTVMTGSHAVVTEMVRHFQVEDSTFEGAWNKGEGGTGYFRLSKAWDSLIQRNTLRGLRHLAVQWSASHNVIQYNDLDADLNLHGGWERYNLFQYNTVRVPYEHRNCSPNCAPDDETWYPIWWGTGLHAGGWAGASGAQNVFYANVLQKQTTPNGDYEDFVPYSTQTNTVFMFGWNGSAWTHLSIDGSAIETWTGHETVDYTDAGVYALCIEPVESLVTDQMTPAADCS